MFHPARFRKSSWLWLSLWTLGCGIGVPAAKSSEEAEAKTEAPPPPPPREAKPLPAGSPLEIFLLLGQSNMVGVPKPEPADLEENSRVFVLGYADCRGKHYNEWSLAIPPLHRCWSGVGPGDSFGKKMAEAWPNSRIGLVPAAIEGVDIDFFLKGVVSKRRKKFSIPPDNQRSSAYEMVLERARLAQQSGRIRGILFHQGESDSGNSIWVEKVAKLVSDLRADLNLTEDVPFIAGELLHTGCCAGHNSLVAKLPSKIPNAHVVVANALGGQDNFHFDLEGQRELGLRYANAMLQLLPAPGD